MAEHDKLKRLAEMAEWMRGSDDVFLAPSVANEHADDIIALIAENERLKKQRDNAVVLLRPLSNMATVCGKGGDDSVYVGQSGIRLTFGDFRRAFAFVARIDAAE